MTENDWLALHKHLVQRPDESSDDPLQRLRAEPSCADDCPDCIQEMESKRTGFATGMGSAEEYRPKGRLDWVRIADRMAQPRWVFDGRGVIDSREMVKLGVRVESVGRQHRF
ncbi:hypothetical protein CDD83_1658 [Cordyceps sp. RAO-2017]|nr:hypothetical protein CDD83_1658 [Cordyceps sp. RAO-2017]